MIMCKLKNNLYSIRGILYHKFTQLRNGEELVLVQEPHNKHDPNAIAVFNKYSEKVGYISRTQTQLIHPILGKKPFKANAFLHIKDSYPNRLYVFAKILLI